VRLCLVISLLVLAGCSTTESRLHDSLRAPVVNEWNYNQAVKEYGQPASKEKRTDGITIARWIETRPRMNQIETYNSKTSSYEPAPPVPVKEVRELRFNSKGILIAWNDSLEEPAPQSDTLRPIPPL
jgi:hypothetical protein